MTELAEPVNNHYDSEYGVITLHNADGRVYDNWHFPSIDKMPLSTAAAQDHLFYMDGADRAHHAVYHHPRRFGGSSSVIRRRSNLPEGSPYVTIAGVITLSDEEQGVWETDPRTSGIDPSATQPEEPSEPQESILEAALWVIARSPILEALEAGEIRSYDQADVRHLRLAREVVRFHG